MQALHVHLDRGSWNLACEDRLPVRIIRMELVEIISANSQFNLTGTLGEARMLRAIIKNNALRQRNSQLILAAAI